MTRVTQISKEEMEPIVTARAKAMEAAATAERALKEARMAELEFKVNIQQLYLMKKLDANCRVDISTGSVAWPDETADQEHGEPEPAPEQPKKKRGKKQEPVATADETPPEVEG